MNDSLYFQGLLARHLPETFYDFISLESSRYAESVEPSALEMAEGLVLAFKRALASSQDLRDGWSALPGLTVQDAAQSIVEDFIRDHSTLHAPLSFWLCRFQTAFRTLRELPFYAERELMALFGCADQDELMGRLKSNHVLFRVVNSQIVAPVWQFEPGSSKVREEVVDLACQLDGRVTPSTIDTFLRSQFPSVVRGVSTEYDYTILALEREQRVNDLVVAFDEWERPTPEDCSVPFVEG